MTSQGILRVQKFWDFFDKKHFKIETWQKKQPRISVCFKQNSLLPMLYLSSKITYFSSIILGRGESKIENRKSNGCVRCVLCTWGKKKSLGQGAPRKVFINFRKIHNLYLNATAFRFWGFTSKCSLQTMQGLKHKKYHEGPRSCGADEWASTRSGWEGGSGEGGWVGGCCRDLSRIEGGRSDSSPPHETCF